MGKILLILYIPFLNNLQDTYHNDIIKYLQKGGVILEELFHTLWGTLLAPLIVALAVTTYS